MTADPARPLTAEEAALLDLVSSADVPGAALRAQAPTARVVGHFGCGCPTVLLAVAEDAPVAEGVGDGPISVDGVVSEEAQRAGYTGYEVIVSARDGRLESLELLHVDPAPAHWPPLDQVTLR